MSSRVHTPSPPPQSQPAWEIARLFPDQGQWSEAEYLELDGNRLVEFTDGYVEVLPMPKSSHQLVVRFLLQSLLAYVTPHDLGEVLFAPLRVRLRPGKIREPDIVFMLAEHADRAGEDYWDKADLVMEVVSEDGRERDLKQKRADYAQAGIPEYWIVDPQVETITVLRLAGRRYVEHGRFGRGERATSALLRGFEVDASAVFDAAKREKGNGRRGRSARP